MDPSFEWAHSKAPNLALGAARRIGTASRLIVALRRARCSASELRQMHRHDKPLLTRVQHCLTNGRWLQSTTVQANFSECGRGDEEWHGDGDDCDGLLHHPLHGDFGGVYANADEPVLVTIRGDSIGGQIAAAISAVQQHNPHLRGLHVLPSTSRTLAAIPSSVKGSRWILDGINWRVPDGRKDTQPRPRASRRLLIIGSGIWYNLKAYCEGTSATNDGREMRTCDKGFGSPSTSSRTTSVCDRKCDHLLFQGRWRNETMKTAEVVANLNHDEPWSAPFTGSIEHGKYAWARRYAGTLTRTEYGHDLEALLEALTSWRNVADNKDVKVAFYETTAQHFVAEARATRCSQDPWPPLVNAAADRERFCDASLTPIACTHWIRDWRNIVARPLLRASRTPAIPLAALRNQSGLHRLSKDRHSQYEKLPDCTHWCARSAASLFLAQASLSVGAALL